MDRMLLKHSYINATLKNGCIIDGDVDAVFEDSFMIDDNVTGDIIVVYNEEIGTVNEYIE